MSAKTEPETELITDDELMQYIRGFDWLQVVEYGQVIIHIREGKPCLLTLQRTIKMD